MNQFATCIRRKGRWISKIKHPVVCAVITGGHLSTLVRVEKLLGWPTYTSWRNGPKGIA